MAANQCQQNYKMSDKEIKVPNIGKIKVGDRVSEGDLILTVEQTGEEEKKIEQKTIKEAEQVANQNQVKKIAKVNPAQITIKKDNSEISSASPKVRNFA